MNAKIEDGGIKTDLTQLPKLCPQETQEGFPVGLIVVGIVIGVILLIVFIVGLFRDGGDGGGGGRDAYMGALALRLQGLQQMDRDIQRGYR